MPKYKVLFVVCWWLIAFWGSRNGVPSLLAASFGETRAFEKASAIFRDKLYATAETSFAEFLARYPHSEFRADAVLYQAKARFFQKNYPGAMDLLQTPAGPSGRLADQYAYWVAEIYFQTDQLELAAEKFGEFVKNFPASPLHLEACYKESFIFSRRGNWAKVVERLGQPEGYFQKAIRVRLDDAAAIQGLLLLGEALFTQKHWAECAQVLRQLGGRNLPPEVRWKQQYLLSRNHLALGQAAEALTTSEHLLVTSSSVNQTRFTAEAVNLQGEILEKLQRLPEAILAYEKNLTNGPPQDLRRQALYKIVELTLAQHQTAEAILRLEKFAAQYTNDTALDLVFLTLGELRLQQFFAPSEKAQTNAAPAGVGTTNFLEIAFTNFNLVISNYPQSDLLGKASLGRGWCFWAEGKFTEAQQDFAEAVLRLPASEELAVARFKLADAQFKLGDYPNAVANYNVVVRDFGGFPAVKSTLFDQALYQVIRASLAGGDQASAEAAVQKILEWYPHTGYAERGLLLVGQNLNKKGRPEEARQIFTAFARKFPKSDFLPAVKLAIARTHAQKQEWPHALKMLAQWTADYPRHELLPHAEFSQALTTYQAGQETNALTLFTNFIARYPSNSLTPLAENWLGDFYDNRDELLLAEEHYQLVAKYNPPLELACRARMNAGRAAWERQDFQIAAKYFSTLVSDTNTPSHFLTEAYFALGDTIATEFFTDTTKFTNNPAEAISVFKQIIKEFPTNDLVPLAWGKLGQLYFQLGNLSQNHAEYYPLATNAFLQVLESPLAGVSARNQATVGLGKVFEALGESAIALQQYARVLYISEGEEFDPVFVKEAGTAAAKLCESASAWEQAINIYQRLLSVAPSLRPTLEKKILIARTQLENGKKAP